MKIHWTIHEEEELIKYYLNPTISINFIANHFNKSIKAIYKKARQLKLNRPSKTKVQLTKSILTKNEIIKLYNNGLSLNQLSKQTNLGTTSLKSFLQQENIEIRNLEKSQRKYKLNFNYFKIIDSCEKAYILGFIAADGYNNTKHNRLALTIHKKDLKILEFIKKCLDSNAPIKYLNKKNHVSLIITNKTLSNDLKNLGIIQAKTEVLQYPNINKKFDSAFMLGYFDGDGTIYASKTDLTKCGFGVVGSKDFIQEYLNKLYSQSNINKAKFSLTNNNNIIYFKYSGRKNIIKIYKFLYKNTTNFCLKRKQERFINIINLDYKNYY